MHIEVLIINEETFSYSSVTIRICIHIEPNNEKQVNIYQLKQSK